MKRSESDWKKLLTPEQYSVLRQKGTEIPFTGEYLYNEVDGTYRCAACSAKLFASDHKFDGLCGWPSFNNVINNQAVALKEDRSGGMRRVEVTCKKCGGHLGHVFNDAPDQPTGMRFCINSVALDFKSDTNKEQKEK
jgi:peptide-methionine (R)-S-oxide reductase